MVDFRKIISPRTQAQMTELRNEILAPRTNAEMAQWILGLARELRETGRFQDDHTYSYDEWALFRVIPEMAARLDPAIQRLPEEMPREAEMSDMVTYVGGVSPSRLAEMAASLVSNASFNRGRSENHDQRCDRVVDMFSLHRGTHCPLSQAANRLTGRPDPVVEPDVREPLAGSYLIASSPSRDTVLLYSEDPDELDRGFGVMGAHLLGEEIPDDDATLPRQILRYQSQRAVRSWVSLSIQDFSGTERVRKELQSEPVPAPEF